MMPSPNSLGTRFRLAALVALLVAFDAVFVVAVYWLGHLAAGLFSWAITYESAGLVVDALQFRTLPSPLVVAVGTAATLAGQSVFGYRMSANTVPGQRQTFRDLFAPVADPVEPGQPFGGLLADRSHAVSADDEDERDPRVVPTFDYGEYRERVAARLTGLAQLSDTPIPDVRVVDSETPNSYVAGRPGEQILVVTTGLLRTLDDEELDAVLAHELAHIKHGDAFVMTAAGFLPTVTARVNGGTIEFLRRSGLGYLPGVEQPEDSDTVAFGQFHVAMVALSPIVLALSSALWLASTACYRSLSRVREFHADAGAAAIRGSPAALVGALETLEDLRPSEDLRTAQTGVRELCVLPDAIDDEDGIDGDDAIARTRRRWRSVAARALPSSHPPIESRVAALREQERTGRR
ncbi:MULTISPECIES: M48 family metalloprotease [Halomicrobium]|nr:M48 family metalloprotease [Halomicrobium mukohataei]QCD66536.1 peptidase M48 Ste24p [Halomicrobium mukohataei]QFR21342.1 M48 family metalloprotease [Halomicrobium sp. ZPS1]